MFFQLLLVYLKVYHLGCSWRVRGFLSSQYCCLKNKHNKNANTNRKRKENIQHPAHPVNSHLFWETSPFLEGCSYFKTRGSWIPGGCLLYPTTHLFPQGLTPTPKGPPASPTAAYFPCACTFNEVKARSETCWVSATFGKTVVSDVPCSRMMVLKLLCVSLISGNIWYRKNKGWSHMYIDIWSLYPGMLRDVNDDDKFKDSTVIHFCSICWRGLKKLPAISLKMRIQWGDWMGHLVHAVEIIPHIQTTILPSQKEHLRAGSCHFRSVARLHEDPLILHGHTMLHSSTRSPILIGTHTCTFL